jgi:RsiW-degrading membrane proteinase PrsW (M82 family)
MLNYRPEGAAMANPMSPPPPGMSGRNVSRSTLFPLLGDRSDLMSKGNLIPIAATVVAGAALFAVLHGVLSSINLFPNPDLNLAFKVFWILAGYISFLANYYIYMLCGREKPWWLIVGVFLVMAALIGGPLGQLVGLYNSHVDPNAATGIWAILGAFFGPGLAEEFTKALPVAALAVVGIFWKAPLGRRIGVLEPLDGILIGVASATGFALIETVSLYVPHTMLVVLKAMPGATIGTASFYGLVLLLARGFLNIAGHLAYSGLFGYYIGLAVLRPASAPRLLIVGWLTAAALHGAWDATSSVTNDQSIIQYVALIVVGVLSYACLCSAILKARKLSPTRAQNFAAWGDSVVLEPAQGAQPQPQAAPAAGEPQPQVRLQGGVQAPKVAAASVPLIIKIGTVTRMVSAGTTIEPMHLGRAGAGRGKGPIAEVVSNPSKPGLLGLRNLSDRAYRAKQPSGQVIDVRRGDVALLSAGVVIDFGGIEGVVQAK